MYNVQYMYSINNSPTRTVRNTTEEMHPLVTQALQVSLLHPCVFGAKLLEKKLVEKLNILKTLYS